MTPTPWSNGRCAPRCRACAKVGPAELWESSWTSPASSKTRYISDTALHGTDTVLSTLPMGARPHYHDDLDSAGAGLEAIVCQELKLLQRADECTHCVLAASLCSCRWTPRQPISTPRRGLCPLLLDDWCDAIQFLLRCALWHCAVGRDCGVCVQT